MLDIKCRNNDNDAEQQAVLKGYVYPKRLVRLASYLGAAAHIYNVRDEDGSVTLSSLNSYFRFRLSSASPPRTNRDIVAGSGTS